MTYKYYRVTISRPPVEGNWELVAISNWSQDPVAIFRSPKKSPETFALEVKNYSYERTDNVYFLSATCLNCGRRHIARIQRDRTPGHHSCPYCGVIHLRHGNWAEAIEWAQAAGIQLEQTK